MKTLIRMVPLPAVFVALLAMSGWIRGPLYMCTFDPSDLLPPPNLWIGLGGHQGVPAVEVRVDGPVWIFDATGKEFLWKGQGLGGKVVAEPEPRAGLRFGPGLRVPQSEVLIVPSRDGALSVGKERYRGAVRLRAVGPQRALSAINEIDLERYLQGVVASEMRAEWPIEALKAQAVAARGFALYELRSGYSRRIRGFDLYDDDRSQVYRGTRNESHSAVLAVRATYGQVCQYRGKVLKSFYQNTCGGHTEPAIAVFQEQDIPPLAGRDCAHCGHSKHFRWRAEVPKTAMAEKCFGPKPAGPVTSVRILEKTPGGLVLKVAVKITGRGAAEKVMTGKEFRSAVGSAKFKSLAFDVASETGDRIVFEGRGWGHLVGLCQEGARGFAERVPGSTCKDLLEYYYPGVTMGRAY